MSHARRLFGMQPVSNWQSAETGTATHRIQPMNLTMNLRIRTHPWFQPEIPPEPQIPVTPCLSPPKMVTAALRLRDRRQSNRRADSHLAGDGADWWPHRWPGISDYSLRVPFNRFRTRSDGPHRSTTSAMTDDPSMFAAAWAFLCEY